MATIWNATEINNVKSRLNALEDVKMEIITFPRRMASIRYIADPTGTVELTSLYVHWVLDKDFIEKYKDWHLILLNDIGVMEEMVTDYFYDFNTNYFILKDGPTPLIAFWATAPAGYDDVSYYITPKILAIKL